MKTKISMKTQRMAVASRASVYSHQFVRNIGRPKIRPILIRATILNNRSP
jgi:hypothetical protein